MVSQAAEPRLSRDRPPLRFTVAKFHRMAEAGLLDPRSRYELIGGQILRMLPPGPLQSESVDTLYAMLFRLLAGTHRIRCQSSVQLGNTTEPLPDFAILKERQGGYARRHPTPDDVLLLIEVSDSTLAYDRTHKARLYAAAGIGEYWIVNLKDRCLHVLRGPSAKGYAEEQILSGKESVTALNVPELTVKAAQMLPA